MYPIGRFNFQSAFSALKVPGKYEPIPRDQICILFEGTNELSGRLLSVNSAFEMKKEKKH
jgi:hypothetical protein